MQVYGIIRARGGGTLRGLRPTNPSKYLQSQTPCSGYYYLYFQYLTELPNNNKYHAGIVGEVPRLLCTLVVEGTADTNKLSTLVSGVLVSLHVGAVIRAVV